MRNGIRKPQSLMNWLPNAEFIAATRADPSTVPTKMVVMWKLPNNPLRSRGAHSTRNDAAPPHSPPAAKPWMSRASTSNSGAAIPITS